VKIAHVFKDFYPPLAAGITCYIADVSDAMARRGHDVEVHVAGVRYSRRERLPSGVVVHRHREVTRALSMPVAPGLVREVRRLDADVIHVHLPNPIGELGVALNRRSGIVCTFHAQLGRQRALEPLYAPLRNLVFERARRILVSGDSMVTAAELRDYRTKLQVLPFGVSPRMLVPPTDAARPASELIRLLFVGRLVYYKGVDVLLRALASVPCATLRIVGDGADRARLEALAAEVGVERRAQFVGSVSDHQLLEEYSEADVFVLPSVSRAEAFGMAMAEAMANGLPAISTTLGTGTDWVNVDGVTGVVVAPGDVDGLIRGIERLREPGLRLTLAARAVQRAQSLFSFDRHVDSLENVYRDAAT
jgi:rhamnosyl/mannosyltransferase